jgi:hypothetical protein
MIIANSVSPARLCFRANLHQLSTSSRLPIMQTQILVRGILSKKAFWLAGFLSGFSPLIEDPRRRTELLIYVLPKAVESVWLQAQGRSWSPRTSGKLGTPLVRARPRSHPHLAEFSPTCPIDSWRGDGNDYERLSGADSEKTGTDSKH